MTSLAQSLGRVSNHTMKVREWEGEVVFLHEVAAGAADRSYGIHVAKLAGVPRSVTARAGVILNTLEADHHDKQGRPTVPTRQTAGDARQLSLFGADSHPLLDELKGLNIDNMTPLQAMQELARLRERAQ